jgi:hypothetical protein
VLHRFDNGDAERVASEFINPYISGSAICLRVRNLSIVPGSPGYWLHVVELLVALADAVICLELTGDSYSESIFFEQVILPNASSGRTFVRDMLRAIDSAKPGFEKFAAVPVLKISLINSPMGSWFVWHPPIYHSLVIDVSSMPLQERASSIRAAIDEIVKLAKTRRVNWGRDAPGALRHVDELFWGLAHNQLLQDGVESSWSSELAGAISANLHDFSTERGMKIAHEKLHDPKELAGWSKLVAAQTPTQLPRTAADKIAAMQASRLLWLVQNRSHSRLRGLIYQVTWWTTTKAIIISYEIHRRLWQL